MKTAIANLGVAIAVANANISGCTVGKVEIAPFDNEYGSGHSRIIVKSFRPSCFRTSERAANWLLSATKLLTYFKRIVRDTTKEQVDPTILALATMNQL